MASFLAASVSFSPGTKFRLVAIRNALFPPANGTRHLHLAPRTVLRRVRTAEAVQIATRPRAARDHLDPFEANFDPSEALGRTRRLIDVGRYNGVGNHANSRQKFLATGTGAGEDKAHLLVAEGDPPLG